MVLCGVITVWSSVVVTLQMDTDKINRGSLNGHVGDLYNFVLRCTETCLSIPLPRYLQQWRAGEEISEQGDTPPSPSCIAHLPLIAISVHVTNPLLPVMNVFEGLVPCGDPLRVVNL